MLKKTKTLPLILVILVALFIAIDSMMNLGIVNQILQFSDSEAPIIETGSLRGQYLLDEDVTLEVPCEDNMDETCIVEIIGDFDTSVLGEASVTLKAEDAAGNIATFQYHYEVVEAFDGSQYIPLGYYDAIDGLEGDALKAALHTIITDHTEYPYTDDDTDVWDILREADEDPDNENHVISFYTGLSIPKDCQDTTYPPDFCEMESYGELNIVEWNREHIWSKSRGDFSNPSEKGAHTDTHHLVAAERTMNSTKNNRFFEDCHDGDDTNIEDRGYGNYTCNVWEFEPRDEIKGDVARMIFYMAVRYEDTELDLEVINDPEEDKSLKLPVYGDIDDLLRWHIEDPVSEKEVLRNEVIYTYQNNRNPFIDLPELVALIWGESSDYQLTSSIDQSNNKLKYLTFANQYLYDYINQVSLLDNRNYDIEQVV